MKKSKLILIPLMLSLIAPIAGCSGTPSSSSGDSWTPSSSEVSAATYLLMKASVEDQGHTAEVSLTSEDGSAVFKSTISEADMVCYSINDSTEEKTLLTDLSIHYISPSECQLSVSSLPEDIDGFSLAIRTSASETGNVLIGFTKSISHTSPLDDTPTNITDEDIKKIKEALNDASIFDSITGWAGTAISAYSGISTVLKMLGIMEDPIKSAVLDVKRSIEQLSGQVTALSADMKAMYTSLDAKLSKISSNVQKLLYIENEKTWEDFRTDYVIKNGIQNQIDNFNNIYTQKYLGFSAKTSGNFTLYYDKKDNLTYPANTYHETGTEWESVDGTIIDESKTVTFEITPTTFARTEGLTHKTLDDETYTSTLKSDLKDGLLTSSMVDESNVDKYVEDALSELDNYSTRETMNTPTSGGILANDIITNFNEYCAALTRSSNNPISAYRYLITSSYNFQSEAQDDLQSFEDYILVQTATYKDYVDLAAKVGNVTNAVKESANTAKANVLDYLKKNTGLHAEKPGYQYCYVTDSYVRAKQYTATISMSITSDISYRLFFYSAAYKSNSFSCSWCDSDGSSVNCPQNVIGTDEAKAINAIYQTMKETGKVEGTFNNYFQNSLVSIQDEKTRNAFLPAVAMISGSTFNFTDFPLDGSVNLTCYSNAFVDNCGATGHGGDYFKKYGTYNIGTQSEGNKASSGYYVQHKSIKSDVMDMYAETFSDNADILYGAIYAEDHGSWQVPETWMFAGAPSYKGGDDWWFHTYSIPSSYVTGSGYITYSVTMTGTYWAIVTD